MVTMLLVLAVEQNRSSWRALPSELSSQELDPHTLHIDLTNDVVYAEYERYGNVRQAW